MKSTVWVIEIQSEVNIMAGIKKKKKRWYPSGGRRILVFLFHSFLHMYTLWNLLIRNTCSSFRLAETSAAILQDDDVLESTTKGLSQYLLHSLVVEVTWLLPYRGMPWAFYPSYQKPMAWWALRKASSPLYICTHRHRLLCIAIPGGQWGYLEETGSTVLR